ncbi:hypothetical protein Glove_456g20 [Diversispora epigaea]|uniref:Protein kinase domain-containing protein n=1 Tax=Diversispora epigaea TaxID=1348612 RepID=A0A397GPA2_9GLOM|nr:hypothetical protein Glove_456g20 [Diversispora epigaea]
MSLRSVKKLIRKSASNLKELIGTKSEDNSNIPTSSTTLEIPTSDNREYENSLHNTELLDDVSELYDDVNDNTTTLLDNVESINDLYQPSSTVIIDTMELGISFGCTALIPFTKFSPLIGEVTNILEEIITFYQQAEHNKRICGSLLDRVAAAEAAVRNLKIRRDDNQSFFTEQNYLLFRKFLQTMNKIKNFIHEISQLSRLGKYLRSASISETFQNLTNEFDGYMNSLHFSITIENHIQAEKDKKVLKEDTDIINDLYQPSSTVIIDTMELGISFGCTALIPFTKFSPLIGEVTNILEEIITFYQQAEHNKRICGSLLDRVAAAEAAVRNLKIRRDDNQSFFTEQNYLLFRKFLQTMNKIKNFIHEISQLSRLGKYLRSASISETFQNLTNEFDGYMNSLHFSITIENHIQAEKDKKVLKEDTDMLKKYLDAIKGGVTDFGNKISIIVEEVSALKNNFDKQSKSSIHNQKPLRLDEIVTDDPLNIEDFQIVPNSNRGKKVHKQIRNHDGCEVAFKEVPVKDLPEYTKNSISVQVTILKKIQQSDEIIKFIGLHKNNDNLYLVMEWVEYGSLRQYYETYGMDNAMKVSIALEISRGLNFLASVQILHRDISTENILITLEKRAKITNFGLSRGFTDATRKIKANIHNVRYMAPEKLIDKNYKYDIKCEVYSFGMLLWEIAELKVPYAKEKDISSIRDRVKKNYRESWSLGVPHPEWKILVSNPKNGAWHPDPSFRPTFTEMFLTLEKIYKECQPKSPRNSPNLIPVQSSSSSSSFEGDCLITIDFSAFGDISVEEAIMEHKKKDGNKKNAWKCFEAHAAVGDISAKYWKGYYLYYNLIDGPKESEQERATEAAKLFQEVADESDMPEAQLRYGNCLFKGEGVKKNLTEAAIYFKKSAENGNATAMFNMGKIYYYGMGVKQDISEGEKYLKLAAYNKQKQAVEMSRDKPIKLTDITTEAAKLFQEVADESDMPEAQLRYGNCLFKGEGVKKNLTEAAIYFKKSAENGNATAMFNMGKIYYYGMGVKQDISEGEKYLKLAAYNKQKQAVEMSRDKPIKLTDIKSSCFEAKSSGFILIISSNGTPGSLEFLQHFAISKFLEKLIKSDTDQQWPKIFQNGKDLEVGLRVECNHLSNLSTPRVIYGIRLRGTKSKESGYKIIQNMYYMAEFVIEHPKLLNNQNIYPRLDRRSFLKSLGTEILAQEDGTINTTKGQEIFLVSKQYYLGRHEQEGTTMIFYETLKEDHKRLTNGVFFFSPIKIPT